MTITLTTIKRQFPQALKYEQIGSKQLFIVYFNQYTLLVSYRTIIGFKQSGTWNITTQYYSVTTSRHITYAKNQLIDGNIVRLDSETFKNKLYIVEWVIGRIV